MLMHIRENVGVNHYDAVWIALEANNISQTGTPEELLKEANDNLRKEHWNKKLKDQAAYKGECDFIMLVAKEQKDKWPIPVRRRKCCWNKKFAHLRPQNKGSKGDKKIVCWLCNRNQTKKECLKQ